MPRSGRPELDVVVVGGANWDYLVKGSELPKPGASVTGALFEEAPGGKGANQAVAVARLGGRVAFLASVGADERGDALVESLAAEGVDTTRMVRHPGAPTGVALIAVDAAGEKQIVWARDIHVIRPNAHEAGVLTGIEVKDRSSARHAAKSLRIRGVRVACVGAPGGTLLVSDDGELWLPHLPVAVVDATGAGDAFAAALALMLAEGSELAHAAQFANAASALATTRVGAQSALPRREAVMALLAPRHEPAAVRPERSEAEGRAESKDARSSPTPPVERRHATARERDLVVLGSVRQDLVVRTPRLPVAGEVLEGDLLVRAPGGKAIRQAIAAARLGARVGVIGRVGADADGEELLGRLRTEGVDTEHVARAPDARTCLALVHQDRRGRTSTATVAAGPGATLSPEYVRASEDAVRRSTVLVAALETGTACLCEAFRLAHRHGTRTVLDADLARKVPDRVLRLTDVVVVAAHNALAVTGTAVTGRRSALRAARSLLRRVHGGAVVLTTERAVLLLTRNDEIWLPDPGEDWSDIDEASDAFCAMLAVALAEGADLSRAGRLATAAAAIAISERGEQARLPTRAEVTALASRLGGVEELTLDGVVPADAPERPEAPS